MNHLNGALPLLWVPQQGLVQQEIELALSEDKELNLDSDWSPVVYEMQGQRFYLQCLFRNKMFMAFVIVLSRKKVVMCDSEVFPIDMTTEDIINSGDCLVMNENEMVKFYAANLIPIQVNLSKE